MINTSELARTLIVSEYVRAFRILVGPASTCPAFHAFQTRRQGASGAHEFGRSTLRASFFTTCQRTLRLYSKKRQIITTTTESSEKLGETNKS